MLDSLGNQSALDRVVGEFGLEGMSEDADTVYTIDRPFGRPVELQARMPKGRDRDAR
jgi:hypothetical protein